MFKLTNVAFWPWLLIGSILASAWVQQGSRLTPVHPVTLRRDRSHGSRAGTGESWNLSQAHWARQEESRALPLRKKLGSTQVSDI
jgi:hypothetical protein